MSADEKEKYLYPVELVLEAYEKRRAIPYYIFRKAGYGEDERVLSVLLSLIGDEEVRHREGALIDLWVLQGSKAISLMHAFLLDENDKVGHAAQVSLQLHADSNDDLDININFIEKALKTHNSDVRRNLVWVLGNSKEPPAQDLLLECLEDEDSRIRCRAASFLGHCGSSSATEPLITLLNDPIPEVRRVAAFALRDCGNSSATEALIKLLSDTSCHVRWAAVSALGEIGDSSAIEPVKKFSNDDPMIETNVDYRIVAACALYKLGEWSASDLVHYRMKLLRNWDQYQRCAPYGSFVEMLGEFKSSEFTEALLDFTNDENPDVRNQAVRDLWKYDDKRVHELYLKISEDESDPCRETALNYLDDPTMIGFYLKNLRSDWYDERTDALLNIRDLCSNNRSGSDSEHGFLRERSSTEFKRMLNGPERKEIMEALSIAYRKIDSLPVTHSVSADELVEIIKMYSPLEEDDLSILYTAIKAHNPNIRSQAAVKLSEIGQGSGLKTFIDILSEPGSAGLRWETVEYLALRKDPESVKPLIKLLEIDDEQVKWSTAEVLGYLNDDLAVDPLIQLLEDPSKWVRTAAAKALGELGTSQSIKPLIELLDDDSEYSRYRAVEALGRVGNIRTISSMKTVLNDECHHVRLAAMRAISGIVEGCREMNGERNEQKH